MSVTLDRPKVTRCHLRPRWYWHQAVETLNNKNWWIIQKTYCWCFWNPAVAPVEVGSWNPIIYRVLHIPGGCLGFLPSTVSQKCIKKLPTNKSIYFPNALKADFRKLFEHSSDTSKIIENESSWQIGVATMWNRSRKQILLRCGTDQLQDVKHGILHYIQ